MKDIDFDSVNVLLDVVTKCAAIGPSVSSIAGEAGVLLGEINEVCRQNSLERANDRAAAEAERIAAEQAQLKAAQEPVVEEPVLEDEYEPIERRS